MAHPSVELLLLWLLIQIYVPSQAVNESECIFQGDVETNNFYQEGDVVIGGLFPLHYSPVSFVHSFDKKPVPSGYKYFSPRALRWMQTMTFAVQEINHRQDILPHLKLGFHIRDTCDDIPVAVKTSLLLVNGQPDAGRGTCGHVHTSVSPVIVGDAGSGVSMAVLRTLGSFNIPLVSYFASCSCLSNKKEFPAFMRTMPSDAFQTKALAKLVSYFHWTWVGVIGGQSDYARFAIQLFLQESARFGVCAAYVYFYPMPLTQEVAEELVKTMKSSSAKVILSFGAETELSTILAECRRQNLTNLQWLASEAWATAKSLWQDFGDLLLGTLGFAIHKGDIPDLGTYLSRLQASDALSSHFFAEFWEETFNCRVNGSGNLHTHVEGNRTACNGKEDLANVYSAYTDVSQLRVSYNVYKAVYLIAHALHEMSSCIPGQGPFYNGTCGTMAPILPWQLLHYMKHTKFSTLGEEVNFDENGDPIAYYDLMNWQRGKDGYLQLMKVGIYDASFAGEMSLVVNESHIQWHIGQQAPASLCSESCLPGYRKAIRKGEPICCFDCIPCAEGEISNKTDAVNCLKCSEDTWPDQHQMHCLPKATEFLSYQETMGLVLCVVSAFGACATAAVMGVFIINRNTPIVRANNIELSFLLLVFLCACFLIALTFIGEPTDSFCQVRYIAFGISFTLCISCILAKTLVVLMAFRATLPGSNVMKWFGPTQQRASVILCTSIQTLICIIWLTTKPPHASHNTRFLSAKIILECAVGSEVGFWCMLGYIGFLACLCLLMAFLARKLPDNFNEAKFITFSMLIFFAVWITFIPVYVSTSGKYTVAVHVFAILASAFGLLVCIFAPKCYIVLLKPEKNSKKHMMLKH